MRGHGTKTGERSARNTDQMVFDREDGFRDDGEPALEEKVVDAHDRTGQRVFDGREKCVGGALIDGAANAFLAHVENTLAGSVVRVYEDRKSTRLNSSHQII